MIKLTITIDELMALIREGNFKKYLKAVNHPEKLWKRVRQLVNAPLIIQTIKQENK